MLRKICAIITIFVLISCNKNEKSCDQCLCYNWIEPIRFSYQDSNSNDLLRSNEIRIDSIKGFNLDNLNLTSTELSHFEYDVRAWVVNSSAVHQYDFIQILNHRMVDREVSGTNTVYGMNQNHRFYIYYNSIEVDSLDVMWEQKVTTPGSCCHCIGHPVVYIKCNGIEITEGTDTAAIIRK